MITFDYRPNVQYIIVFISAMVLIPIVTYVVFYYYLVPDWATPNSQDSFYNVKETLVRYGYLSENQSQNFSYNDMNDANKNYTSKAIELALLDLSGWDLFRKVILPLLIVICSFIFFTFKFWMPGITKRVIKNSDSDDIKNFQRHIENYEFLPGKTLDYLNDLNKVIITVEGFLISILGGFMVSSGLNNFYFFLGFEVIISSLVASLAAYPSFISTIQISPKKNEQILTGNYIPIYRHRVEAYFRIANFAAWSLVLGLVLLATSFS